MGKTLRGAIAAIVIFTGTQGATFAATTDMAAPDSAPDVASPAVRQAPFVTMVEDFEAGTPNVSNTPQDHDDDHANE
jgi:hypothetical protein